MDLLLLWLGRTVPSFWVDLRWGIGWSGRSRCRIRYHSRRRCLFCMPVCLERVLIVCSPCFTPACLIWALRSCDTACRLWWSWCVSFWCWTWPPSNIVRNDVSVLPLSCSSSGSIPSCSHLFAWRSNDCLRADPEGTITDCAGRALLKSSSTCNPAPVHTTDWDWWFKSAWN